LIFTNFCSRRVRKTGIPAGGQKFISGDDTQTPCLFARLLSTPKALQPASLLGGAVGILLIKSSNFI